MAGRPLFADPPIILQPCSLEPKTRVLSGIGDRFPSQLPVGYSDSTGNSHNPSTSQPLRAGMFCLVRGEA